KAENVDIEVVPHYPFSLDSQANAVQNIGLLNPGSIATKEIHLFVDRGAQKGTRSIDIRTRASKDSQWSEKSFDIRIGTETFDSKGTVELKEVVSDPVAFMPGDRGTVTVTLTNAATTPTVSIGGKDFDTNARIQAAVLRPLSDGIIVLDAPYGDMGLLGPGNSLKLTFNVKVAENASEGAHNLELGIEGNSFDYSSRKNIPIKVDSSNIRVIPSKELQMVDGKATLGFDVANTHPNTLSAVSIRPEAQGVKFYPAEYFIGPMTPDELLTIVFNAVEDNSSNASRKTLENINMSLISNYNNGANKHENTAGNLSIATDSGSSESNSTAALAGGLIIIAVPAALLVYRRKNNN
ncbi:MAG TPA: COG1361 S-layer family protein, partial [Methanosarcina sp.]|nr:COG1361 S-layer family protein [Methanosarcina sp.]